MLRSTSLDQAPRAPRDPALPGGDRLVDRRDIAELLSRGAGFRTVRATTLRFESVRYKPGARLVVGVRGLDDEGVAIHATLHAFRRHESESVFDKLQAEGAGDTNAHHLAEDEIVVTRFPFDHELPGLRHVKSGRPGATYVRRLVQNLVDDENRLRSDSLRSVLLRYKPGRHAVFHLAFRVRRASTREKHAASLIARVYRPEHAPFFSSTSVGGVTPITLGVDAHRGVAIESFAAGTALTALLGTSGDVAVWERVGRALAAFHDGAPAAPVPEADTLALHADLFAGDVRLWETQPECHAAFSRVVQRLVDGASGGASGSPVRVHGDLHLGQVLVGEDQVHLVDIEKSAAGLAEQDVGALLDSAIARVGDGRATDRAEFASAAGEIASALFEGYHSGGRIALDVRSTFVHAGLSALSRAAAPMRNLHPRADELVMAAIDRGEAFHQLSEAAVTARGR